MRAALMMMFLSILAGCQAPRPAAGTPPAPERDIIQRDNDAMASSVLASIAGKEQQAAGQVFKNVQYLANTDARTFVSIMNEGYAKALGVRCTHCHVPDDFASDELRPKRAAREMQTMHRTINQQLAQMKHINTPASSNRAISCIMCHRGAAIPVTK